MRPSTALADLVETDLVIRSILAIFVLGVLPIYYGNCAKAFCKLNELGPGYGLLKFCEYFLSERECFGDFESETMPPLKLVRPGLEIVEETELSRS